VVDPDRLLGGETVAIEDQVESSFAAHDVQPLPQAVPGGEGEALGGFGEVAAVSNRAEDRVLDDDRRGCAQGAAKAQVDLAAVVPGAARLRLAEPACRPGARLEAAAGRAVVLLAGIPIPVMRFLRAAVHKGPGAEVRRVAQPEVLGRLRGIEQCYSSSQRP
jgi:hypothetical protein